MINCEVIWIMRWGLILRFTYAFGKLLQEITTENFIAGKKRKKNIIYLIFIRFNQKYNTNTGFHILPHNFSNFIFFIHGTLSFSKWYAHKVLSDIQTFNYYNKKHHQSNTEKSTKVIVTSMSKIANTDGY